MANPAFRPHSERLRVASPYTYSGTSAHAPHSHSYYTYSGLKCAAGISTPSSVFWKVFVLQDGSAPFTFYLSLLAQIL